MKPSEKGFPCDKRHQWKMAFCTAAPRANHWLYRFGQPLSFLMHRRQFDSVLCEHGGRCVSREFGNLNRTFFVSRQNWEVIPCQDTAPVKDE